MDIKINGLPGASGRISTIFVIAAILFSMVVTDSSYASKEKDKKKKKGENSEVDDATAKKNYEFELLKSWSFGWENYKNKQYESAKKHFLRLASIDTVNKFPKVYGFLGDSFFKLGDIDSAQYAFETGAEKYPDDAYLHRMIGFIKAQREQINEAIEEYEKTVALEPESKDDWKQLAALYVRADRIEDAIAAYDKVLAIDPNDIDAQQNQSALYSSTGDIEGAIENKRKVAEQDPKNIQVRFDLGKMTFDKGYYEESIKWFKEFLVLSPDDVAAIDFIGKAYYRLEQYNSAITEFKKIMAVQLQNKAVLCEISSCYKELGNFTSARSYANKAIGLDRGYGLGWIALGEAYEASAEKCVDQQGGKLEYKDKLMYKLAANQYKIAMQDPAYRADAERKLNFLMPVVPTKDDEFMHKDEKEPTGPCYLWIK